MGIEDIKKLLPDPDGHSYNKIKKQHPYYILLDYAKAIGQKYPNMLSAVISESLDNSSEKLLGYTFYIVASIGTGYSYKLLELEPQSGEMYPISIKVFQHHPQELSKVRDSIQLIKDLNEFLSSNFTQNLFLNLLAQVELYRERQNK